MNNREIALRVIARLNAPVASGEKWPVTLPKPTTEQIVDWLSLQEVWRVNQYREWADRENGEAFQAKAAELEALNESVQRAYAAGELTQEQYERIYRWLPPDERGEVLKRVKRWRPLAAGRNTNDDGELVTVYDMIDDNGGFMLTYEHGQWWRHADYPYSVFRKGSRR